MSLSTRLDSLSVALETQIDSLTIYNLHARIFREEECKKRCDVNNSNALPMQGSDYVRSFGDSRKPIISFSFRKQGRKKDDCRKRKACMKENTYNGKKDNPHALSLGGDHGRK